MAEISAHTVTCSAAVMALLNGDWAAFAGLPAECSLSSLVAQFGPAQTLDPTTRLGAEGTLVTRSSLANAPITAWHDGDRVVLIECDLLSAPLPAPVFDAETMVRRDVEWGVGVLAGGEWVAAARGLALIVTPLGTVTASLGFAPTTLEHYLATLKPRRGVTVPLSIDSGGLQ